jgi:hypothetical protein
MRRSRGETVTGVTNSPPAIRRTSRADQSMGRRGAAAAVPPAWRAARAARAASRRPLLVLWGRRAAGAIGPGAVRRTVVARAAVAIQPLSPGAGALRRCCRVLGSPAWVYRRHPGRRFRHGTGAQRDALPGLMVFCAAAPFRARCFRGTRGARERLVLHRRRGYDCRAPRGTQPFPGSTAGGVATVGRFRFYTQQAHGARLDAKPVRCLRYSP